MRKSVGRILAACAVAVAVAACGSSSASTTTSSAAGGGTTTTARYQARLNLAKCLRSHGVNVPDPSPNGGVAGGRRLLSHETARALSRVQTRAPDRNLVVPMVWRLGYHQAFVPRVWLPRAFGHFGYAGSGGWCDPSTGLAMAFVSNRIYPVSSPFGDLALMKLGRAALTVARAARAGSSSERERDAGREHEHAAADAA